jgi:hypothetical protein
MLPESPAVIAVDFCMCSCSRMKMQKRSRKEGFGAFLAF